MDTKQLWVDGGGPFLQPHTAVLGYNNVRRTEKNSKIWLCKIKGKTRKIVPLRAKKMKGSGEQI